MQTATAELDSTIPMKTAADRRRAVLELLELQDRTRPMFQRMDLLKQAIAEYYPAGTPVKVSARDVVIIEDQFADKISAWKSVKFDRYLVKRV